MKSHNKIILLHFSYNYSLITFNFVNEVDSAVQPFASMHEGKKSSWTFQFLISSPASPLAIQIQARVRVIALSLNWTEGVRG